MVTETSGEIPKDGSIEDVYVRRIDERARDSFCMMQQMMIAANIYNSSMGRNEDEVARVSKKSSEAQWRAWAKGYGKY